MGLNLLNWFEEFLFFLLCISFVWVDYSNNFRPHACICISSEYMLYYILLTGFESWFGHVLAVYLWERWLVSLNFLVCKIGTIAVAAHKLDEVSQSISSVPDAWKFWKKISTFVIVIILVTGHHSKCGNMCKYRAVM